MRVLAISSQCTLWLTGFLLLGGTVPPCSFSADDTSRKPVGNPAIVPLPRKEPVLRIDDSWLGGDNFSLTTPKLGLNALFLADNESIRSRGVEQQTSIYEFRQGFSVATDGWVLHPAFLQMDLQIDPQWSLAGQSGDGPEPGDDSVFLASYSAKATLLPNKIYTLGFFADRREDNLISTFANQTRVSTDTYGTSLAYKLPSLPTFLRYLHLDRTQDGFFTTKEQRDDVRLDVGNQHGDFDTRFNLQYIDSQQTSETSGNELEDLNTRLYNTWRFNADSNRQLFSDLSYRQSEDDFFERSDLRLLERLYLKHRQRLWTNSSFLYQNRETDQFAEDLYRLDSELTHLLYENLTTTLYGSAEHDDFEDGEENAYTGALDFDYRRDIPWGTFGANAGFRDVYTVRSGDQTFLVVNNETQVLNNGQGTFLAQEFIDAASIRVTDSTGTVVFVRDQDYLVEQIGTFIRLRRTLLGNIDGDRTVLVSYRFSRESGFDDNLLSQSYGTSLFLLSTLRLSYTYFHRDQQIISGQEPVNPIDDTLQRTVLQLFYRWSETSLSYEAFDTTTSPPRTTWRAEELLNFEPARTLSFRLSGYYGETEFEGFGERETFNGTASSLSWAPSYWTRTGVEGFMDWVSSDTIDSSNGGVLAFWQLLYGRWQANLSYRYRDTQDEIQDFQRTEHRMLLTVTRTL